jgi:hypothetical protein
VAPLPLRRPPPIEFLVSTQNGESAADGWEAAESRATLTQTNTYRKYTYAKNALARAPGVGHLNTFLTNHRPKNELSMRPTAGEITEALDDSCVAPSPPPHKICLAIR